MAAERQPHTFDQQAVAKALHAESSKLADPAYGQGWHFEVNGTREPLSLDTFPEAGVSRIITKGARIELFGGSLPTVEDEGVVFLRKDNSREHSSVTLHPDGGLTLGYMLDAGPTEIPGLPEDEDTGQLIEKHEAVERTAAQSAKSEAAEEPAEKPGPGATMIGRADAASEKPTKPRTAHRASGAFPDERPLVDASLSDELATATDGHVEPESTAVTSEGEHPLKQAAGVRKQDQEKVTVTNGEAKTAASEQEGAERVQLVGRLGRTPTFRTTAGGKFVGKFPLAVHLEDGETAWHDVLAFGDRATTLQKRVEAGQLNKGNEVDVVGYRHIREYQGKDGTPKTAQEIYLAAVKRR